MPINFNELFRKINYQLPIGASNRAGDLERTGNWSYEAQYSLGEEYQFVEKEVKKGKHYFQRFFISTWSQDSQQDEKLSNDGIAEFARDTARSYVGRSGNCRERTGLMLVYLLEERANVDYEFSLINFYPPIDHQLLLVKPKNGGQAYCVDPWTEKVVKYEDFNSYIPEMLDIIIKNEKARAIAQEIQAQKENEFLNTIKMGYKQMGYKPEDLKKEIRESSKKIVDYCTRAKNEMSLVSDKLSVKSISPSQQRDFIGKFYSERDKLIDSHYPKKPRKK